MRRRRPHWRDGAGTGLLVAYASKYGATREIAEVVADTLRYGGRPVDVMAVRDVRDPSAYDAVVLGSALYLGAPLHDADTFLERHRDDALDPSGGRLRVRAGRPGRRRRSRAADARAGASTRG